MKSRGASGHETGPSSGSRSDEKMRHSEEVEWTGLGGKAAVGSARSRVVLEAGKRHSFPPGCTTTEGQDCEAVMISALDVVRLRWQGCTQGEIPTRLWAPEKLMRGYKFKSDLWKPRRHVWKEGNSSHRWARLPSEPEKPQPCTLSEENRAKGGTILELCSDAKGVGWGCSVTKEPRYSGKSTKLQH